MAWTPQLNTICGRCGKPRGLRHVCVSNSNRKATIKPAWSFGQCPRCRKTITNPLTHTCRPKSDFKQRRAAHEKRQRDEKRAAARKQRPQHDYQACSDQECPRPLCKAYRAGWQTGHQEGYEQGWQAGYDKGFPDGIAACPLPHGGS
jgi:hypothetical protein